MNKKWFSRKWLIGAAAGAVLLIGVGVAVPVLAQTQNAPPTASTPVYLDSATLGRAATALGMTTSSLTDELKTGETLAEIAQANNVPDAAVVAAIVAPYSDSLALQVKYGYMTQAQSQTLLQNAQDQATNLMQQNLSTPASGAGADTDGDGYYGCWDIMSQAFGSGSGFGPGMMGGYYGQNGQNSFGPGMMWGWENGNVSPSSSSGSNSNSGSTAVPGRDYQGYGMMGGGFGGGYGGMMGSW